MHFLPRSRWLALAAAVLLVSTAAAAKALLRVAVEPVPGTQQVLQADTVVVGKVVEIEKEPTKAKPFPNSPQEVEYKVAVVKIDEALLGGKGVTNIRVGFPAGAADVVPQQPIEGRRPVRPIGRVPAVSLAEGEEGCFFLTKHPEGDFYVMPQFGGPLDKKAADYDKQLATIKKMIAAFENPKAALKSESPADRATAAVALVQKYRTYPAANRPNAQVVQEPIDAEESKLILTTLSEMKWMPDPNGGPNLQQAFYSLGLQPKDGWTQPKFQQGQDFNKVMGDAATKWLKDNADKYRIQRNVVKQ